MNEHGKKTGHFLPTPRQGRRKQPYFSLCENDTVLTATTREAPVRNDLCQHFYQPEQQTVSNAGSGGTVFPGRGCRDTGWAGGEPTEEHSARTGVNIGPQERAPPGFGTSLFISVLHQQREKFLTPALPVTVTPFRSLRSSSTL